MCLIIAKDIITGSIAGMTCTNFSYSQANGLQRLLLVAVVHVHGLSASFELIAIAIYGKEVMTCCAVLRATAIFLQFSYIWRSCKNPTIPLLMVQMYGSSKGLQAESGHMLWDLHLHRV